MTTEEIINQQKCKSKSIEELNDWQKISHKYHDVLIEINKEIKNIKLKYKDPDNDEENKVKIVFDADIVKIQQYAEEVYENLDSYIL